MSVDGSAGAKGTCRHTEIEGADQSGYLSQSQYIETGPNSPSTDRVRPGVWQAGPERPPRWPSG